MMYIGVGVGAGFGVGVGTGIGVGVGVRMGKVLFELGLLADTGETLEEELRTLAGSITGADPIAAADGALAETARSPDAGPATSTEETADTGLIETLSMNAVLSPPLAFKLTNATVCAPDVVIARLIMGDVE
jgi:hypothetical protein